MTNKIFKDGDIVKKDLTSHAAWFVEERDGKLLGIPIITSRFKDETIVDIDNSFIKLMEIPVPDEFKHLFKSNENEKV